MFVDIMFAGEQQMEPLRKSACMMKTKVSLTKDRYCLNTRSVKWLPWRKATVIVADLVNLGNPDGR